MNPLLATVEPDAFEVNGSITNSCVAKRFANKRRLYYDTKVEDLLSECRKQTLLEAATMSLVQRNPTNTSTKLVTFDPANIMAEKIASVLRRMAEGEKK